MASSFPYLAIARQIAARYGDVLCFADSLDSDRMSHHKRMGGAAEVRCGIGTGNNASLG